MALGKIEENDKKRDSITYTLIWRHVEMVLSATALPTHNFNEVFHFIKEKKYWTIEKFERGIKYKRKRE